MQQPAGKKKNKKQKTKNKKIALAKQIDIKLGLSLLLDRKYLSYSKVTENDPTSIE